MAEGSERKKGAPQGASDPPNRHKRVGSTVRGKYRIDAFIATGTMANVYAATHRNGARVALKILHKTLAEDASLCERFKREGYFANSIGHPGIVRAIDDDITEDGCPFLVMELLEGETLEQRRRRKGGRLPSSWVLPIADSLLEILAAAHAREVVHRDLKPDNVFVTKDGEVKVLDFGVARWNDGKTSSDMTAVGMVLGTPAYMPPEQALGRREDVDAQSDIWAVGATLFVVLSGESVHVGGDAKAKLIATARTAARPLREAAPDVPRGVAAVIDRALAFHKSERWPDAEAMREALRWARMSLEDRPSQKAAASSAPAVEPVVPPVTRRNMDDEPTLARAFPRDDAMPGRSPSHDLVPSASPVTLRDVPKSTAAEPASLAVSSGEPVFSLRREREAVDSSSPSTERYPKPEDESPRRRGAAVKTAPGIGGALFDPADLVAPAMATYNPSATEAMGIATASAPTGEVPVILEDATFSAVDVAMSFTKPMAAMVMPSDWPAPRPAAGAPADKPSDPVYAATFPEPYRAAGPPPAFSSAPPAPYPAGPSSSSRSFGSSSAPTEPPRRMLQLPTEPSRRLPDEPGPMLAQIVRPARGGFLRVGLPVFLGFMALIAGFIAVRTRQANARARASMAATAGATSRPSPSASTTSPSSASASPAIPSAHAAPPSAPTESATPNAAVPAPPPTVEPKKKKPRPRPRPVAAAKPAESSPEAPAAPVTTATPTDLSPPSDTTPRDSLPTREPDPKPAPVDSGAN